MSDFFIVQYDAVACYILCYAILLCYTIFHKHSKEILIVYDWYYISAECNDDNTIQCHERILQHNPLKSMRRKKKGKKKE